MHELGILRMAARTACQAALKNDIKTIRFFTLEIGELSGFVPLYFEKYFPIIREEFPPLAGAELRMETVPEGHQLLVKEIGY